MNPRLLLLQTLLFACLGVSCQKDATDPCEGVLSEGSPKIVGILFVDKETGENIVTVNDLDTTDVKVVFERDGTPFKDYLIASAAPANPVAGAVVFYPREKEDIYLFNIRVADFGAVKFSYTVTQKETGNRCRPHSYPVSEVKIVDYQFEQFEHEFLPDHVTLLKVAL